MYIIYIPPQTPKTGLDFFSKQSSRVGKGSSMNEPMFWKMNEYSVAVENPK